MSFLKFLGKRKDDSEVELPPIDAGAHELPKLETPSKLPGLDRPAPPQPLGTRPPMMAPPKPPGMEPPMEVPPMKAPVEAPPMKAPVETPPMGAPEAPMEPLPEMSKPVRPPELAQRDAPTPRRPVPELSEDDFLAEPILRREEHISPKSRRHEVDGPLYVKVNDFRSVMADLDLILNDLKESNNILIRLNSIKNGLDGHFEKWHSEMEDIQRKLVFIDKTLFEELW